MSKKLNKESLLNLAQSLFVNNGFRSEVSRVEELYKEYVYFHVCERLLPFTIPQLNKLEDKANTVGGRIQGVINIISKEINVDFSNVSGYAIAKRDDTHVRSFFQKLILLCAKAGNRKLQLLVHTKSDKGNEAVKEDDEDDCQISHDYSSQTVPAISNELMEQGWRSKHKSNKNSKDNINKDDLSSQEQYESPMASVGLRENGDKRALLRTKNKPSSSYQRNKSRGYRQERRSSQSKTNGSRVYSNSVYELRAGQSRKKELYPIIQKVSKYHRSIEQMKTDRIREISQSFKHLVKDCREQTHKHTFFVNVDANLTKIYTEKKFKELCHSFSESLKGRSKAIRDMRMLFKLQQMQYQRSEVLCV